MKRGAAPVPGADLQKPARLGGGSGDRAAARRGRQTPGLTEIHA